MSTLLPTPPRATLADLMRADGKAELIGGKVVTEMSSGELPVETAGRIYRRLADHADTVGGGRAYQDGLGYAVPELPSGRESFQPDVSFYTGPRPANRVNRMRFIDAPPDFAVEVRSESDYGPAADQRLADKRTDYFQAGTRVVWDVDPLAGEVRKYTSAGPDTPVVFAAGQEADAEPAVPGWRLSVDWLMR